MSEIKQKEKVKQVKIRLTESEVENLSTKAEKLGLTVPGYLKYLALNKPVKVKSIVVSQKFDDDTFRLLRGIATNLNQLARLANIIRLSYRPEDHGNLMKVFRQLSDATTAINSVLGNAKTDKKANGESGILGLSFDEKVALIEAHDDKAEDALVSDPSDAVRCLVAQDARDKDLDILVSDPAWAVRAEVALLGRPGDEKKLWRDPDWRVRRAVALAGSGGSDTIRAALAADPDRRVREAVSGHAN